MSFLEDEEDARVFEAALSFVDECFAGSDTSSFNNAGASVSHNAPSFTVNCKEMSSMVPVRMTNTRHINAESAGFQLRAQKPKKPNPNRVRDEAQFELVYLRAKVNQLEEKLRSLRLNTTASPDRHRTLSWMPRVWEEIAERQQLRRDEAEHQNAHLKLLFERQQKMTASVCKELRKRLTRQNAECLRISDLSSGGQHSIQVLDFDGDIGNFHDLFQRLEAAYNDLDAVFAANGLSDVQIPTDNIHVRKGADVKHVEIFASKLLPFSLHDTGEAAWDHFKGIEKHLGNGGLYGKAAKNLDQPFTIFEDFTKEVFSHSLRADVQAKQIVQRCMEPDRDLILFVSSMTPVEIKHKAVNGLVYHVREYAVTKCMPGSTSRDELSLLQLCTCISLECEPGIAFDERYIHSVAQFWIGNIVGNLRCYQERIENALVERALSRQKN